MSFRLPRCHWRCEATAQVRSKPLWHLETTAPVPLGASEALRRRTFSLASPARATCRFRNTVQACVFRLPGPPGASETLRRRAFSPARATWRFRNTAQACVVAFQGNLALQKHCAGGRFRLPGPPGASEALRRRAFSPARATWRFRSTYCASETLRRRAPAPLGASKPLQPP